MKKKYAVPIAVIIGMMLFITGTVYARSQRYRIKLDVGEATSSNGYLDEPLPFKHIYVVRSGGTGTLRIDMSGTVNTWPIMEVKVGKHKYRYTSQDGNSLHAEIPIKAGRKATVEWGLTQGKFPALYSYRFVIDP